MLELTGLRVNPVRSKSPRPLTAGEHEIPRQINIKRSRHSGIRARVTQEGLCSGTASTK